MGLIQTPTMVRIVSKLNFFLTRQVRRILNDIIDVERRNQREHITLHSQDNGNCIVEILDRID